jgi:predicted nucleic acid-binding protein
MGQCSKRKNELKENMKDKNKIMLDTNAVLRFIVGDDEEKNKKVSELLIASNCIVPIEVIAETVYNLEKSYNHPRHLISEEIKDFKKRSIAFIERGVHENSYRAKLLEDLGATIKIETEEV